MSALTRAALTFTAVTSAAVLMACPDIALAGCDAVLIPTQFIQTLQRDQELALAVLVQSQADYERAVNAGAQGAYGLFSAGGNYGDFAQQRNKLLQQQNFNVTNDEAQKLVTSYLPPESTQRWLDC